MSQIIKYFVNYLLEQKMMKLSIIEETFYIYKKLDKKVTLRQNIIELNYLSESPYPLNKTQIVAITEEDGFYLWFNKEKGAYRYYLPEALLLFRKIIKKHSSVIFIVNMDISKVIVVKDSQLISSFSKHNVSQKDLRLIESQYDIDNVVVLDKEEYSSFLEESFNHLKPNDIFNILDIKFDIKSLFNKTIHFSALPLFISVGVISLSLFVYNSYLDNQNQELHNKFKNSKLLTIKVRDKIENVDNLNKIFKTLSHEFDYKDKIMAISAIMQVSEELNVTIFYINSYNTNIDFIIKTQDTSKIPLFTNKLFETNFFSNIKNVSSQKVKGKVIKVTMNAKLEHI